MKKAVYRYIAAILCPVVFAGGAESAVMAAEQTEAAQTEILAPDEAPELVGGWEIPSEIFGTELTNEDKELFEEAAGDTGYEPAAILGTQVVAGVNYLYLCLDPGKTDGDQPSWQAALIYRDPGQKVSLSSVFPFDLTELPEADEKEKGMLVGGWSVYVPEKPANQAVLPEEAYQAFQKAMKDWEGPDMEPLTLLGSQVVAGMNYEILCRGSGDDEKDGHAGLYAVRVYADLSGGAEVTECRLLDLTKLFD